MGENENAGFPGDLPFDSSEISVSAEVEATELVTYKAKIEYKNRPDEEVEFHEADMRDGVVKMMVLDKLGKFEGPMGQMMANVETIPVKYVNMREVTKIDIDVVDRETIHPDDYNGYDSDGGKEGVS